MSKLIYNGKLLIRDAEDESDHNFEELPVPGGALSLFAFSVAITSKLIYNGY